MRTRQIVWLMAIGLVAAGCGSASVELSTNANTKPAATPAPQPAAQPTQAVAASEPQEAVIEGDRIKIAESIHYDVDKDEIRPESFSILNAVANILKTHPEITQLTVEGHTDDQGSVVHNLRLSERRANAVVRYLALQGVMTPMQAPGYGATAPVCFSTEEECRAKNRRVEFKIKTNK